ncbi:ankyrin repeat-containing protein BDA1-like [Mangifera indica]|uniref:ankyrin repeat-containing protein BDA1-like n=1 Tax=Mangifera indica TaxID=29780 RepID=UPI001CF96B05|nr:ankyrin repeat-containing protein BDA1-like [Mangifera indica]
MEAERLQMLGNVDDLFSVLEKDPYVLERIEQIPFVTTPLHTAASEGNVYFAKEILNLKPSFARKRDHLGRSPLHLALEGKHLKGKLTYQQLVTWLIKHDSELVRVKAKGMITPLHYAAQVDDESNLADFLYVCPSSIKDLTVKGETAVHVALKNRSLKAFKVLLGFLRRFDKEEILNWEDEEGKNALDTAVSVNHREAVKLLIRRVNKKNGKGLTDLDTFDDRKDSLHLVLKDCQPAPPKVKTTPISLSKKIIIDLFGSRNSLVEYFSRPLNFSALILKSLGLVYQRINQIHLDARNILLVVAVLVATATYQAALSPPGGYWQDEGNLQPANSTTNIFNTGPSTERAGHMILASSTHFVFLMCNSLAFFMSVYVILILTTLHQLVILPTTLLVFSFCLAVADTSFYKKLTAVGYCFDIFLSVSALIAYGIPLLYHLQGKELRRLGQRRNLRLGSF